MKSGVWSLRMALKLLVLMLSVLAFANGSDGDEKSLTGLGNFEPRNLPKRTGPGEDGEGHILSPEKKNLAEDSEREYGMNVVCSNEISMHRSIPDTRSEECKYWDYPFDLSKTSVIIVFRNEAFSVLMRAVHSVIDRSPKHILQEILLVDDQSNKPDLKENLDTYLEQFNGLVRLIRNTERGGMFGTRSRIAKEATGEVVVFLNARCEVNINWLPPLLAPIYRDRTVVTVPIIDKIDRTTFEYHPVHDNGVHYRGIFDWGMGYRETELPEREVKRRANKSEPYRSPTQAGKVIAINREYFLELGGYNPSLIYCDGQNLDLSFKIWQCGGSIEWVPCSRVGQVNRSFMPKNLEKIEQATIDGTTAMNYKQIVETWFDDSYKEYFYSRVPLALNLEIGDITEQLAFKERHKCKSFQWFMNNVVYGDVSDKLPALSTILYSGELRSIATDKCLDSMYKEAPAIMKMQSCHGSGISQFIRLNTAGQLSVDDYCIVGDTQGVKLGECRSGAEDGPWHYNEETKQLQHKEHKLCMTLHSQTSEVMLRYCEGNDRRQQFRFNPIKPRW